MTRPPDFDELIGYDVDHDERERLRRAHDLLVQAGAPPELSPELERGPTLGMTVGSRRPHRRRVPMLAAAAVVAATAFLGGYAVGNGHGNGIASGHVLRLAGTAAAPSAFASLRVDPVDQAGNWPMELSETGLPKLPAHAYYAVYLYRDGRPYAPCGTFVVAGKGTAVSVRLNAPYELDHGDTWVVTKILPGHTVGQVVMRPTA